LREALLLIGKGSILFSFEADLPEGEGPSTRSKLGRDGQRQAFMPAVILFIALPEAEDKIDPG
jgi:hypothetical protein